MADGATRPLSSSVVWLKPKLGRLHRSCGVLRSSVGGNDGPGCWLFPAGGHSRHLWSLLVQPAWMVKTGIRPIWPSCSRQADALVQVVWTVVL